MIKMLLQHGQPIFERFITWGGHEVKLVAVFGVADDWAAYIGESMHTPEKVVSQGLKLNSKQADGYFPVLNIAAYRD